MVKKIIAIALSLITALTMAFAFTGCINQNKTFTVTFTAGSSEAEYYSGELVQTVKSYKELVPPIFVRDGYNFDGWDSALSRIDKDTVLSAVWAVYKFEVTFNANGGQDSYGQSVVVKEVKCGLEAKKLAPKFTKSGYELSWDIDCNTLRDTSTVNAVWTPKTYTLDFKDCDQSQLGVQSIEIEYDSNVQNLPVLQDRQQDGKTLRFCGWQDEWGQDFTQGMRWNIAQNTTAFAKWTEDENVIKYNLNGAFVTQNQTSYKTGQEVVVAQPIKYGYDFEGWTGTGIADPIKDLKITADSGDKEFYANWKAKTFTLTLDYNGGTALGSTQKTVTFGEKVGELAQPERAHHVFMGWKAEGAYSLITKDSVWELEPFELKLTAQYKKIYKISFSLTTKHTSTILELAVDDWGDVPRSYGNTLDQVVITVVEGESLASHGIYVMPKVDPIEPATGKPNGDLDDYFYNGYWKYSNEHNGDSKIYKIKPDTKLTPKKLPNAPEDGRIYLIASCLKNYA